MIQNILFTFLFIILVICYILKEFLAYSLKNTVSDNGYVSRGECTLDKNGYLTDVTERVRIEKIDGILKSENNFGEMAPIDENTTVSMNFWGFTPKCFEFGEKLFLDFF